MTTLQHQGTGAPGVNLETQVIAGLIAAPAHIATSTLAVLEADDFEHWINQEIFSTLSKVSFPDHQEPGSVLIQVSQTHLEAGKYADRDNGLRAAVENLAGIQGHPEQLAYFVTALIEQRFRRDSEAFGHRVIDHAQASPLQELNQTLATIQDLRESFQRIPQPPRLEAVGGAA